MGHLCPTKVTCAGCGIRLSDGYTTASDYAPECKPCTDRRTSRLRRGQLFSETGYAGEAICNTTGTDRRAHMVNVAEVLYGWEPGIHYVKVELATRGQAKSLIADETDAYFLDLRCRKVWLHEREITGEEAEESWLDDWWPGYVAWIACSPDADGATLWWELREVRNK